MFNTNEMDRQGKEYRNHRMDVAAHDDLVWIARGQPLTRVQRYLGFMLKIWQNQGQRNVLPAVSPRETTTQLTTKRST